MIRYHVDGGKIRQIIAKRGYTNMTDFAKCHGLNRATMNNYIKGSGPFSEAFYEICDALQIDPLSILSPSTAKPIIDVDEIMPLVMKLCLADKEIAVGLLGSRILDKHHKYSDWDICITRGKRRLTGREFLRLKRTVDYEVDRLPREVDFINLDAAPEWFLLDLDYEPVYLAGNSNAWAFFLGVLHGTRKEK